MSITKTTEIKSIRYQKSTIVPVEEPDLIWVDKVITVDDPEDDQLPIVKYDTYRLFTDSDVSGEDELVKKIHSAVFGN